MTLVQKEVKRITIRPNGTEKQIRPSILYEYSYDFRNKSTSQITSDGWSYSAGNTPSFGTYGVYGTGPIRLAYDISSYILNAKKINIGFTTTAGSSSGAGVRLAKTVTSSIMEGLTGPGYDNDPSTYMDIYSTSNKYSGITAGTYNFKGIIDLENKTRKLSITGKSDQTGTLTDTEVSNILNNTTKLFVYVTNMNSSQGVTTINLRIEY